MMETIDRRQFRSLASSALEAERLEAAELLWRTYAKRLCAFCRNGGLRGEECLDLAQDILLKAIASLGSYSPQHAVSTWVYAIARNCLIDRARRRRFAEVALEAAPDPPAREEGPAEAAERRDEEAFVASFLEGREGRERQVLFLRYYEDLSFAEVSLALGMPEGTAKWLAHQGKAALREAWEAEYGS